MKKYLTILWQALSVAAVVTFLPCFTFAQQVTVNRVYGFSGGADTFNSQINYVYADTNKIIALGMAHPDSSKPYAFTAAFDYSGNLLWQKPIRLPDSLYAVDSGYNNLVKAGPNLYVAGGNIANVPKVGHYLSKEPFLYFFNGQGDSIRLARFPDSTMNQRLTAVAVDSDGNIIAGGFYRRLDTSTIVPDPDGYWFVKLNRLGQIIYSNKISLLSTDRLRTGRTISPDITKIIPVSWDSVGYVVAKNETASPGSGEVLWLNDTFGVSDWPFRTILFMQANPSWTVVPSLLPRYEFNLLAVRGYSHTFFWSIPARVAVYSNGEYRQSDFGLYYCRGLIRPFPSYDSYHMSWYRGILSPGDVGLCDHSYFPYIEDRSEMSEAINADLLMQREASCFSDSVNRVSSSLFYFPVLSRSNDTGLLKWRLSFQYVSTDTGVFQRFYDLSVAPDGKIVMGGFVQSRYPISGYDTVGRVSWLVILSDTVHDQQPQPPEPTGINVVAGGQKVQFSVYPNPTATNARLVLQNYQGKPQYFRWQLCDLTGRVLQSRRMTGSSAEINLRGVSSGIYFVRLSYKGKSVGSVNLVKE